MAGVRHALEVAFRADLQLGHAPLPDEVAQATSSLALLGEREGGEEQGQRESEDRSERAERELRRHGGGTFHRQKRGASWTCQEACTRRAAPGRRVRRVPAASPRASPSKLVMPSMNCPLEETPTGGPAGGRLYRRRGSPSLLVQRGSRQQ